MSQEKSITRDCVFDTNKDGKYYFTVKEGEEVLFQSDLYDDLDECTRDGIGALDILHDINPLQCHQEGFYNGANVARKKGELRG